LPIGVGDSKGSVNQRARTRAAQRKLRRKTPQKKGNRHET